MGLQLWDEEMKIILIYPDLGKKTEDEIIDWIKAILKNPSYISQKQYTPLEYVEDIEVER